MLEGRDVLLAERRDHVYVLTLNREERRNALSYELRQRIDEELRAFNDDPDLWVLVLTGAGDRAFCAGMDLREYSERAARGLSPLLRETGRAHALVRSWKPMIAAINGDAVAGGWSLAQHCDLRIAADTARLGITENRWNLPAPFSAEAHVFPTAAIAAEVTLLGRPITAQRAYEIGFVNEVVAQDRVLPEALAWAEHICTLGQEAVRAHKKLQYYSQWAPSSEIAGLSEDLFYWIGDKPGVVVDATVGSRAFAAGEQPDFGEMFQPRRLRCPECGAEYVVARRGSKETTVTCCGREIS